MQGEVPDSWNEYVGRLGTLLEAVCFTDATGTGVHVDEAFSSWTELTVELRKLRNSIYLIGNGEHASMASHFAADLAKNALLHAQVFSDLSLITAISNDIGYEQVFAEPLQRRGCERDMLVAISSSGRSPNILKAVAVAQSGNEGRHAYCIFSRQSAATNG